MKKVDMKKNKHADIPPMIQDMKDELKKLNIFAIKGILKYPEKGAKLTIPTYGEW